MREENISVRADEVLVSFGWYEALEAHEEHEVVERMADEIVRLREALAAATRDTERLNWLADEPVFDNIGDSPLDIYELSFVVAEQNGRTEPNADDQREAFRRLIDAALEGPRDQ